MKPASLGSAQATLENIIRIGYCDIFNLRLLYLF